MVELTTDKAALALEEKRRKARFPTEIPDPTKMGFEPKPYGRAQTGSKEALEERQKKLNEEQVARNKARASQIKYASDVRRFVAPDYLDYLGQPMKFGAIMPVHTTDIAGQNNVAGRTGAPPVLNPNQFGWTNTFDAFDEGTGIGLPATGIGLPAAGVGGPTVVHDPVTNTFKAIGPIDITGTSEGTDLAALANEEAAPTGPVVGSLNTDVTDLKLSGTVDFRLLSNWINNLVNQGYIITNVYEDPNNPGTVYAEGKDAIDQTPFRQSTVVGLDVFDVERARQAEEERKRLEAEMERQEELDARAKEEEAARLKLDQDRAATQKAELEGRLSLDSDISRGRLDNETERLDLDRQIQEARLELDEAMARIEQDIARDRIQHEQEIASGNWQNALDVQDRIDERERAGRQLERDMFNANQELQNRKFELERASFDLDKLEFFQQLSASPANFADLFNISRGLAPTGAGGPMPQGISRIGQSDVQQTAAQDFRSTGINMAPNINTGALPQLGAEQAVPKFSPEQTQLSFLEGGDPTPLDWSITGADTPSPDVLSASAPMDDTGELGGEGVDVGPGVLAPVDSPSVTADSPQQSSAALGALDTQISASPQATAQGTALPLQTLGTPQGTAQAPLQQGGFESQVAVPYGGITAPQGAPLPPGLQMAFNRQMTGAPQTAQQSIPLLSPQALNQLTPAEREVYFRLAQMQGQYLPDFQNLLAARGGSRPVSDTQRVFV